MTHKDTFKELLSGITRNGIENLAIYLEEQSDFYTAPCSTKYHLAVPGGLLLHSLNVNKLLAAKDKSYGLNINPESLLICSLLHDICKVNFYGTELKWRKDERNQWESYEESYEAIIINDQFPIGHGEKSVIILQQFIHLTIEEQLAIRWHMGPWVDGFASYAQQQAYYAAVKKSPLIPALYAADYEAIFIFEKEAK